MENTKDDIENSDTSDRCPECSQKTNNILYNYSIWKDGPFNTTDSVNLWNIDNPDGIGIATNILPFVAPEVLRGGEFTKAADIYGFGMFMLEIISGGAPFADRDYDLH
ncbi:hypothetical protein RhiirA1_451745 [Rhizophagus irregularis]|uniref:Uncharacterized protein n=1 Tax=Rhizophagus irregularis TaxID=588596 RepID=A0A2I1EY58_9GLOM|nr:hypothetical protein RhiirA1_451745 [Rhizophagus irregularis]PKY27056.1 hypothetical protein RhiirB3_442624 [Rhizophagus irregularis]